METKDKIRLRLADLRERQGRQLESLQEREKARAHLLAAFASENKYALEDSDHIRRMDELQYRDQIGKAKALTEYINSSDLELLRHDLREEQREPDFQDYRRHAELDYSMRRQELLDQDRLEGHAFERRLTELRALSNNDVFQTVLLALIEHRQAQNTHERLLEEINARAEADILKEAHTMRRDNNLSRLRREEMFEQQLINWVFSRLTHDSGSTSRSEIDALVQQWESEAEEFKH